jgi:hypothetical protein
MREEFEPELNLELQYTKNTLKFKKSLYFHYNFGADYLLDGKGRLFVTDRKASHCQKGYSGITNKYYTMFGCG